MGNLIKGIFSKHPHPSGTSKPPPQKENASSQDMTILKLKSCRDKLLGQKRALYQNSSKAEAEAKQLIREGQKNRALFALKRAKLYQNTAHDMENQYAILEKSIVDVESAVQLAQFTEVLAAGNDLIKQLETTIKLEEIQQIGEEIKEREEQTRQFNKLFEEHHVDNGEVDAMFDQFEREINEEQPQKVQKKPEMKASLEKSAEKKKEEKYKAEEDNEGDEEINKQLEMLA